VSLNTYIVRVYRRKNGIPQNLVGVVEEVGKKEKRAFTSLDDLWDILKPQKNTVQRKREKRKG
jgi:hypothetical protein